MIDYNISKYIDTDEPNAEPNIDSTEALNNVDITDNADITEGTDITDNPEIPVDNENNEAALNNEVAEDESAADTKEHKVPDILGNNKLGYNIWDTIVKGV